MDLTYFNPNWQKETDFVASFVARQTTLEYFLRQLSLAHIGQPARHHLIVAPRGFGKTSLLRRIAISVRSDADLKARFIPLRFREEQHNVISLDVLWRNCLQSLLEAREDEEAEQAELDALDADWTRHAPRQELSREEQDGEPAWQTLLARCQVLRRRPILLIDNLDSLLAGLSEQHQWGLRKRLQADDGPVLLAAASRYPDATHNPNAAFYEFFRIQTLDKLDNLEVFTCLRNIAAHRGAAGKQVLASLGNDPGRVAALNTLAGGNPRTLAVLYSVLESHISGDVLSQLSAMLDTFTGWYQARTEELPMQARAVFDALALHWDPMTAAALGLATGLDTPTVSSQLSRLERTGYVETVALSRRKSSRNGYQVSERFFNIWYLMRNGPRRTKQSVRFLTTFLESCFSAKERQSMARAVLREGIADPSYVLALATSRGNKRLRARLLDHVQRHSSNTGPTSEYKSVVDELRIEWRLAGQAETRQGSLFRDLADLTRRFVEATFVSKAELRTPHLHRGPLNSHKLGRSEQEIEVYDELISRIGGVDEPALRRRVANALLNEGITLGTLGRLERAIKVYDDLIARAGRAHEHALRECVASALLDRGFRLDALGRSEQEIEVYEVLVGLLSDADNPTLRHQVATALLFKGRALETLDRSERAIEVYDDLIARFGEAVELALRECVAGALLDKGFSLGMLDRSEQEIEAYDNLIARFGGSDEPTLREQVVDALYYKGSTLSFLGRSEQEIEVYDDLIARFGGSVNPALLEQVARTLLNKGITLADLGRPEQAIEVYDDLIARFSWSDEPALRKHVVDALFYKGITLTDLGRPEKEIELTYRAAIEREPTSIDAHKELGDFLFDFSGDLAGARKAYSDGLAFVGPADDKSKLHSNLAYLLTLSDIDSREVQQHLDQALTEDGNLLPSGRRLLEALSILNSSENWDWNAVFVAIGAAVTSDDNALWNTYANNLERLLGHVLAKGKGADFKQWMEEANYPTQYAPLYHAFVAALEGEDHLLLINPETREPASKIHAGIVRRLKLYRRA